MLRHLASDPTITVNEAALHIAQARAAFTRAERLPTQYEHAREIRQVFGYRDFSDPAAAGPLRAFRVAGLDAR